jgi:hypothetical protein
MYFEYAFEKKTHTHTHTTRILTDEDVVRVWSSIDTAVELMMDESDTETSVNDEVASGSV